MRSTRLIHFTDIHYTSNSLVDIVRGGPALKRFFGWINFNLLGRSKSFGQNSRENILQEVSRITQSIDPSLQNGAIVFTGDATSMALSSEFIQAFNGMAPVLDGIQSLAIPGNHDIYTKKTEIDHTFHGYFHKWSHKSTPDDISVMDVGNVKVVGLETCRPRTFDSSGFISSKHLSCFKEILDQGHPNIVLAIHYPLLHPSNTSKGVVSQGYHETQPNHSIENGHELMELIESSIVKPRMIIHGHIHHPSLSLWNGIPISNPGCSASKGCSFSVYDIESDSISIKNYMYNLDTHQFDEKCWKV